MSELSEFREFREFAEWDWVQFDRGSRLHAIATVSVDVDEAWADGITECGRRGQMLIPALSSRMSALRCAQCCERTGMPKGNGSPKNDGDAARAVAEARVRALEVPS